MKSPVKLKRNGDYNGAPCFEVSVEIFGFLGVGLHMFHHVYASREDGERVAIRVNRSLSGKKKPERDRVLGSAYGDENLAYETYEHARDYALRIARSMGRELDDMTPMRILRAGLDEKCSA